MSTLDFTMLLNDVGRGTRRGAMSGSLRTGNSPLRMVLVEGEALRLPLSMMKITVLAGTAWITQAGSDTLMKAGACFDLSAAADRAVVSSIGTVPLLFEMR